MLMRLSALHMCPHALFVYQPNEITGDRCWEIISRLLSQNVIKSACLWSKQSVCLWPFCVSLCWWSLKMDRLRFGSQNGPFCFKAIHSCSFVQIALIWTIKLSIVVKVKSFASSLLEIVWNPTENKKTRLSKLFLYYTLHNVLFGDAT